MDLNVVGRCGGWGSATWGLVAMGFSHDATVRVDLRITGTADMAMMVVWQGWWNDESQIQINQSSALIPNGEGQGTRCGAGRDGGTRDKGCRPGFRLEIGFATNSPSRERRRSPIIGEKKRRAKCTQHFFFLLTQV